VTDSAFLFHVLEDGKWHGQSQIIAQSMVERGCGLTVHSRASDLRKQGCVIECELRRNGHGRALSYYRLVKLEEAPVFGVGLEAAASISAAGASSSVSALAEPSSMTSPVRDAGTLPLFTTPGRGAYSDEAA
jgi:hypothetical protein